MANPANHAPLTLPLVVEVAAVVIGSLSGAVHAVARKADIVGTFTVALATGVGGGLLRDILIGATPPVALQSPRYLPTVAAASLAASIFAGSLARAATRLAVVDAVLLGLWTVMGVDRALAHGLPAMTAIFVGTVTATGGSALRDVATGDPPAVFRKGQLHVTAAFLAATVHVLLLRAAGAPAWVAQTCTVAVAAALRLAALRWNLTAPEPIDLPSWWRRRRSRE